MDKKDYCVTISGSAAIGAEELLLADCNTYIFHMFSPKRNGASVDVNDL